MCLAKKGQLICFSRKPFYVPQLEGGGPKNPIITVVSNFRLFTGKDLRKIHLTYEDKDRATSLFILADT